MTKQTIKRRIDSLENHQSSLKIAVISQDLDDPKIWHDGPSYDRGPGMTWDQVMAKYPDDQYQRIRIIYDENWRGNDYDTD